MKEVKREMARKLPIPISRKDYEEILKACKDRELKAVMMLMFEGGMRISEVVGLKDKIPPLSQDRVESSSIRILAGKGRKDRIVPRPKRFTEAGRKLLPLKIKRRTIQRQITKLGLKVLKKHITPHTLRHGFATFLLDSGRPLHEVQMLLGHARLDTTGVYLHANPTRAIQGARDVF